MKYELLSTPDFNRWLKRLKDRSGRQKVLARLARVENGNFGDYKQLAADLFELRFFFGGGLRIYYTIQSGLIVLLLVGGDKPTQGADIEKAGTILLNQANKKE